MQRSFGKDEDKDRQKYSTILDKIDRIIDFRKKNKIPQQGMYIYEEPPPIPPLILFRTLLLEAWRRVSTLN